MTHINHYYFRTYPIIVVMRSSHHTCLNDFLVGQGAERHQPLSFSIPAIFRQSLTSKAIQPKKQGAVVLKNLKNDINHYHFFSKPGKSVNHINLGSKLFKNGEEGGNT